MKNLWASGTGSWVHSTAWDSIPDRDSGVPEGVGSDQRRKMWSTCRGIPFPALPAVILATFPISLCLSLLICNMKR